MQTIDQLANQFFHTDLPNTPVYKEIVTELQQKYKPDQDGEYPEAYWAELGDLLHAICSKCAELALPQ